MTGSPVSKYLDAKLRLLDPRFRELEPAAGDFACCELQVRKIDEAKRTIDAVVSTPEIDRYEEIVEPKAYRKWLKYFKANPVMLAAHDHSGWSTGEPTVIGRWANLEITDEAFSATAEFMPDDELAEKYWRRYRAGYMRAFSVGFIAHAWDMREFPVDNGKAVKRLRVFTEVELLEISAVAVPANRGALARAASFVASVPPGDHDATQSAVLARAIDEAIDKRFSDPDGPVARRLEELLQRAADHEGLDYFAAQEAPPTHQAAGDLGLDELRAGLKEVLA